MRVISLFLVVGLFVPLAHAGEDAAAGNWKVTIFEDGQPVSYWLVLLEAKGGKLAGNVESLGKVPPTSLSDARVSGDLLQFSLKLQRGPVFIFEGRLPKAGGKKIFGSLARGAMMIPALMEATAAKNSFELDRELVLRTPNDPRIFGAVSNLIAQAKDNKVPAKDVQEWVETALRSAENYGPRWHQELATQMVEALLAREGLGSVAVATAQSAVKLLDAQAPFESRLRLLTGLGTALRQAGEADKAREVDARIDKLESVAYTDYESKNQDFKVAKFTGRKTKSNRAVLVELFTGAQCPPCVAADLAFDALPKAYDARDVVLLQYHLHVPGPDALTNADSEARAEFYGDDKIRGTPTVLFSGRVAPVGGGGREDAEDVFKDYRKAAEPLLDVPAGAQLDASAVRKGDKIHIKASVRDLEKPGPQVKLRIALVEDWARYKGRNGLGYHHQVVRAFPGGVAGLALPDKNGEQSAVVDLEDLRKSLTRYLNNAAKEQQFLDSQRPMRLRGLSVVAFVQNDATHEVVQAVHVPVKEE